MSTSTSISAGSYHALRENAVLVDRSARIRTSFRGEKAKEALGGLLTNDVVALSVGQGQNAAALTPKGRVISVVRVFNRGDDFLVDAEPTSGEAFVAMIRKFVNPRLAKYDVLTDHTASLGVYGPRAAALLAAALKLPPVALDAMAAYGIIAALDNAAHAVRSTEYGGGFDVIGSRETIGALRTQLEAGGIAAAPDDVMEIARVEAGTPRFGRDLDAETIPQEANLDDLGAISFNKGCYTGQEIVARIHFRGHVNRHLRWLTSSEPLPVGAVVLDTTSKEVGNVRSSVVSPRRGPLAIAMVRREVEPGSAAQVRVGERSVPVRVEKIA